MKVPNPKHVEHEWYGFAVQPSHGHTGCDLETQPVAFVDTVGATIKLHLYNLSARLRLWEYDDARNAVRPPDPNTPGATGIFADPPRRTASQPTRLHFVFRNLRISDPGRYHLEVVITCVPNQTNQERPNELFKRLSHEVIIGYQNQVIPPRKMTPAELAVVRSLETTGRFHYEHDRVKETLAIIRWQEETKERRRELAEQEAGRIRRLQPRRQPPKNKFGVIGERPIRKRV